MDPALLLDRVRERLRAPAGCGAASLDRVVADAMRPGKLLRPDLLLRSAAAAGGVDDDLAERFVAGATAIELLHLATLVHDDIIDGSPLRRGRPSVVASVGAEQAIVVGDLLLARGVAAAADAGVAATWARALACMATGQLLEPDLVAAPSIAAHAEYVSLKTAELFRASAEAGALIAGAPPGRVRALGRFALHFGMAFQHLDDLLDVLGDPDRMGKPTGLDAANGVPTAVSLLAGRDTGEDVAGLVGRELDAAVAALAAAGVPDDLARWATASLRRALRASGADDHHPLAAGVTAVLDRVDRRLATPTPMTEPQPCATSTP
ncbi:polyprenyl synthetase family protein [Nocardioides sp. J54]|uniref:polyprenyl synthetase family protein n=1 Tax=Nocardioides sp. J54 TaxID=935866 RepID=UPI0004BCE00B|nr:polyprenyl synthetase family protein [Nocardioides sp. J54]